LISLGREPQTRAPPNNLNPEGVTPHQRRGSPTQVKIPGPGEGVRFKEVDMKKQEPKKLTLTRETVRHLEKLELEQVAGGLEAGRVSSDNRDCTYSRTC
jgi:hypothetical protein